MEGSIYIYFPSIQPNLEDPEETGERGEGCHPHSTFVANSELDAGRTETYHRHTNTNFQCTSIATRNEGTTPIISETSTSSTATIEKFVETHGFPQKNKGNHPVFMETFRKN